jgi:hypothetical protein
MIVEIDIVGFVFEFFKSEKFQKYDMLTSSFRGDHKRSRKICFSQKLFINTFTRA